MSYEPSRLLANIPLEEYYVQFGYDGHLHIVDDQKRAKELFEKQLLNLKAVPEFGKDCYAWVSNRHRDRRD